MKNQFRRMMAGILAMLMVISSPVSSLAEVKAASPSEATTEYETASPSNASFQDEEALAHGVEKESDAKTLDLTYDADLASPSEAEEIAFNQSQMVDGIVITVTADKGVFPKGAKLKVTKVINKKDLKEIDAAVEEVREEDKNVASSNTFDIQILNEKGNEIQPDNSKGTVNVKFSLAEKLNEVLDVAVYHVAEATPSQIEETETIEMDEEEILIDGELIDDVTEKAEENEETPYKAEALETEIIEKKRTTEVEVKTESFSVYVVEFTYGELQYVLEGDTSVKLSEIQETIGLPGKVTAAEVSNEELFTVTKDESGEDWTVTAKKEFNSVEWLKLEIEGKLYEINVTDTVSRSQTEAVAWIQDRENEAWAENYDGVYAVPQCVDLVCYYLDWLGLGGLKGGNGYAYADKNVAAFDCTYQSSPAPGDIAVWRSNTGMATDNGHVALVKAVEDGKFYYVDVNGATGLAGKGWISNTNPSVFLRPHFVESASSSGIYWGIDSDGVLKLSSRKLTGTYEYSGIYSAGDNYGWLDHRDKITEVIVGGQDDIVVFPKDSSGMFYFCNNAFSFNFNGVDTSQVTNMRSMFYGCTSITSLDLSSFDTRNVTDMSYMFSNCCNMTSLNLKNFDTRNVTDMSVMFYSCYRITDLDISGFDTKKVTNMSYMFYDCYDINSLKLSSFDTYNVTDITKMFYYCESITTLDLSSFDTSNVVAGNESFVGCHRLSKLTIGARWTLKDVFPTPYSKYITGADGNWRNEKTGEIFAPVDIPVKTAATYVANIISKKYTVKWKNWNGSTLKTDNNVIEGTMPTYNGEIPVKPSDNKYIYSFIGWNPEITAVTGDITYKAVYEKSYRNYTITYNLNGGKNNTKNPSTYTIATADIKLQNPSRTGYAFAGWYSDSKLTKKATTTIKKGSTGNKTFYAKWTANAYTVKFNGNGSTSGSMSNQSRKYGDKKALTANAFKKTGYSFTGWNTKADGKGTAFANKATTNIRSTAGTTTLYAQWSKVKYKITYNLNGGTNNKSNPASYYVTTSTITLTNPTRTGYTFDGWYSDSKYKTKVTSIKKGSTGNKTLYAKWSATKYKITYNLNGGKNSSKNPAGYYITTADIKLQNPTKTGYTFGGWYSDSKYKTKVTTIKKGSTGNKTLYAKWTAKKYTITYNLDSGKNNSKNPETYTITTADIKLANPTRTGYVFGGWYSDSKFKTKVTTIKKGSTGNKTLYAKWTANKYTIAFNANGGSGSMSKMTGIVYGSSKALTANKFTRKNYTFQGWSTSKTGDVKYANKAPVKNLTSKNGATVTLYAIWKADTYTIAFNANGGTGSMSKLTVGVESSKALTANAFKKTGYTFEGWSTSKTGSVKYKNKATVKGLTTKGKTITLYAVWKLKTYRVTLRAGIPSSMNDDSDEWYAYDQMSTNYYFYTFAYNDAGTLDKNSKAVFPTIHAYNNQFRFVEWNTDPDGNGESFRPGDLLSRSLNGSSSEIVMYAIWELKNNELKITPEYQSDKTVCIHVDYPAGNTSVGAIIYRSDSIDGTYELLKKGEINQTEIIDDSVYANKYYYYKVVNYREYDDFYDSSKTRFAYGRIGDAIEAYTSVEPRISVESKNDELYVDFYIKNIGSDFTLLNDKEHSNKYWIKTGAYTKRGFNYELYVEDTKAFVIGLYQFEKVAFKPSAEKRFSWAINRNIFNEGEFDHIELYGKNKSGLYQFIIDKNGKVTTSKVNN